MSRIFKKVKQKIEEFGRGIPPGRTTCNHCGKRKNNKSFVYQKSRVGKDGYWLKNSNTCKPCLNKQKKILYELNKKHKRPPLGKPCPLCKRPVGNYGSYKSKWCLDHNHKTLEFRGWICSKCNNAIGRINDDNPETFFRIGRYLSK